MPSASLFYELLLDYCHSPAVVEQVVIGLVWTLCQSQQQIGLAMSPSTATRTLPWSGSLGGKSTREVATWIWDYEPYKATVAMATINSVINSRPLPESLALKPHPDYANLAVFEHFLPQLRDKNVVVIGHYPGIERYQSQMRLTVLERTPKEFDLPDSAAEFLLPNADWVFITASSIPNKTFPRLAELAQHATTVLMGPTVPWLPQLHEFGIDYLAGIEVIDTEALQATICQGGGVRIFNQGVRYRVAELAPNTSMTWLKREIAECYAEKSRLTSAMDNWYASGHHHRFPDYASLEYVNNKLSRLDSSFKALWDRYGAQQPS